MAKQTEQNVGIYMRLSQEDMRSGESLSIENQKLMLTRYVHDKGWNLVDEYIDDGYSGTDFNRPGIERLLGDAQTGRINVIVVKDLSRFGRNYIEVGRYIDYIFPMNNIRFIAINDNVDTAERDSMALDMMPIINMFNEWHCATTSKKIKAAFQASARAGKFLGNKPAYGYTKGNDVNHLPVVNPETAPVVKRIFDMRLKGMSQRKIADVLNAEGITCPSDYYYDNRNKENTLNCRHLWSRTTVDHILKNPMYLGHLVQLKSTTISHKNHKCVMKDESDWVVVENTHEPLITQEIWDRCREIDAERTTGRRKKNGETAPLSTMLYCADCGFTMNRTHNSKWRGTTTGNPHKIIVNSYRCSTYAQFGKDACSTHYISENVIEKIVLDDIRSMIDMTAIDEAEARKYFLSRKQANTSQQITSDNEKLCKFKTRIAELDKLMQSAYADKVSGEIPATVCSKLLQQYEDEQNTLILQVKEIETRLLAYKQNKQDVDMYIERLRKYENAEKLTREMVLDLIDHITIDEFVKGKDRNIRIFYKFIDKGYSDSTN